MGNSDEAAGLLSKAIDLNLEDAYSYQWRGRLYQTLKEFDSALKDLTQAVKLSPNVGAHVYRKALIYLEMGRLRETCNALTEAVEQDREDKQALALDYFWRGVSTDLQGDSSGAKIDWEQAELSRQSVISLWIQTIYDSVMKDNSAEVVQRYRELLKGPYPWHILPAHVQHHKVLSRLYPQKSIHLNVQEVLEQALQN